MNVAELFAKAALEYQARGYHPIPLVATRRSNGSVGYQPARRRLIGYDVSDATDAELARRPQVYGPQYGLGLRAAPGQVCLDVDHRSGGTARLAELQAELGPLPPTWRSTARGRIDPGGHYWYRVPTGKETRWTEPGGGVDIIAWHLRYGVEYPTRHATVGRRYRWYGPDGQTSRYPPPARSLPMLPDAWVQCLSRPVVRPASVSPRRGQVQLEQRQAVQREAMSQASADLLHRRDAYLESIAVALEIEFAELSRMPEGRRHRRHGGWRQAVRLLGARDLGALARAGWTGWDEAKAWEVFQRVVPKVMADAVPLADAWADEWQGKAPREAPAWLGGALKAEAQAWADLDAAHKEHSELAFLAQFDIDWNTADGQVTP